VSAGRRDDEGRQQDRAYGGRRCGQDRDPEESLRLEPVARMIYRRATQTVAEADISWLPTMLQMYEPRNGIVGCTRSDE